MTSSAILSRDVGVRVYGLGAIALALCGLIWGDFAVVWDPNPQGVPGQSVWGYVVAVPFLLAGLALQWRKSTVLGDVILVLLYLGGALILHLPRIIRHPSVFVSYEDMAEQLALVAGGVMAYASCAHLNRNQAKFFATSGRMLLGLCLIIFGLAHLFYLAPTASLVPAWLPPNQIFWAYATAGGHFAAGLALLTGVAARPAAILLTVMFIVFACLVHLLSVIAAPHNHFNWSENAINFALIGCAWVAAATLTKPTRR